MKRLAILISCLVSLLATAQGQERVPVSAVDSDGAYIEYTAMLQDGKKKPVELGRFLNASECFKALEKAFTSTEFASAIRQYPIIQGVCVATRVKA